MRSETLNAGGLLMRWEEAGEGPPVVFVHGIPTCPALWRHVIPRIRRGHCRAWEMVGYGGSIPAGRERDISIARQAEYLAAWMRELGIRKAVLVGHDLGGGVAQILAVNHPELVAGLVLMNAICYDSWPIPSVKMMRAAGGLVTRLPDPAFRQVIRTFLARGHETTAQAKEAFSEHWPHYEAADGAAAFVRQVRALDVSDTLAVADRIRELKVPARIVWGAADQFQKIKYGERLSRDLRAPLDRIEGGKHFVPEDHPERVAAAVNAVVNDAEQARAA